MQCQLHVICAVSLGPQRRLRRDLTSQLSKLNSILSALELAYFADCRQLEIFTPFHVNHPNKKALIHMA